METCDFSTAHEIEVIESGEVSLRGIVSSILPIEGLGYLQADDMEQALILADELINDEKSTITWRIGIYDENLEPISSNGISINVNITTHDLTSVSEFEIDPIEESVYSLATLIGCFSLMLILPLIIYFSAVYKAKKDESVRMDAPNLDS